MSLLIIASRANTLELRWVDNTSREEGFYIERRQGESGNFQFYDTVDSNITLYRDNDVESGMTYCYRVQAFDGDEVSDYSNIDCAQVAANPEPEPDGDRFSIPGRIQAEDYNQGGEGVGYHDRSEGNQGGQYRNDDVDIYTTSGGFRVGSIWSGEWLEYDVDVTDQGTYELLIRVSRRGWPRRIRLEVDGTNVTGSLTVPDTGSDANWQVIRKSGIALSAGPHTLRLYMEREGFNVDWFELR
jgi:hypothetical protein